jgi:hypothetical protein
LQSKVVVGITPAIFFTITLEAVVADSYFLVAILMCSGSTMSTMSTTTTTTTAI